APRVAEVRTGIGGFDRAAVVDGHVAEAGAGAHRIGHPRVEHDVAGVGDARALHADHVDAAAQVRRGHRDRAAVLHRGGAVGRRRHRAEGGIADERRIDHGDVTGVVDACVAIERQRDRALGVAERVGEDAAGVVDHGVAGCRGRDAGGHAAELGQRIGVGVAAVADGDAAVDTQRAAFDRAAAAEADRGRGTGVVDGDGGAVGAAQRLDAGRVTAGVNPAVVRVVAAQYVAGVVDVDRSAGLGIDGHCRVVAAHGDRTVVVDAGAALAAAGVDAEGFADAVGAHVDFAVVADRDRVAALGLDARRPGVAECADVAAGAIDDFGVG